MLSFAKSGSRNAVSSLLTEKAALLNDALREFVAGVREAFKGRVTYSAGMWEMVDWSLFDIVGLDHYRASKTPEEYVAALDRHRIGKPLIVIEVGSCVYERARVETCTYARAFSCNWKNIGRM